MLPRFPCCCVWQKNCNFLSSCWSWPCFSVVCQWFGMLQILIFSPASQVSLVWSVKRLSTSTAARQGRRLLSCWLWVCKNLKQPWKVCFERPKSERKPWPASTYSGLLKEGTPWERDETPGLPSACEQMCFIPPQISPPLPLHITNYSWLLLAWFSLETGKRET